MITKYKQIKVMKEHCGDCGEMLSGNGSITTPYTCKCGTWTGDYTKPGEYRLLKDK